MDPLNPGKAVALGLLARAQAYCAMTGTKQTVLSLALTGNPSFLTLIERGLIERGRTMRLNTADKAARRLTLLEANPEQLISRTARERIAELENQDGEKAEAEQDADRIKRHPPEGAAIC